MKKLLGIIGFVAVACTPQSPVTTAQPSREPAAARSSGDPAFRKLHDRYIVEFLRRNPAGNTYLGGAGLDPSLRVVDGQLRDNSPEAIRAEDEWLDGMRREFAAIEPANLSAQKRIDRELALSQITFMLHLHRDRRYQQRALDTYTDEPFRAVDFQLQGMTQTGPTSYGTEQEWNSLIERLGQIPRYLAAAEQQLRAGIDAENTPDWRMLQRNGIKTAEADAKYFEETLAGIAAERIAGPRREEQLRLIGERGKSAGAAYRKLRDFVAAVFFNDITGGEQGVKPQFRGDRFILGEEEYGWAVKNNLRINNSVAELYEEAWPIVVGTQNEMIALAREIGAKNGWPLPAEGPAAVRAVFDQLSKDYPKSDAEMVAWYREAAFRLVDYSRKTGIFDVPADYKLNVVETPAPLRASVDGAAYYPAPPFKNAGVGVFFVTPTDNDPAALQSNNRSALADLSAHEGFPGHDWHYKVMTQYRDQIPAVRWINPGAIEDSSSMWGDSMAAEGWALYSEALMAEPQPGAPAGFYTPDERLYQLQGKLYRDLRVRIDTGIHTGRIKYDEAVDLFSEIVDFLPGSCKDASALRNDAKRASCESSERAIFRYSKWPTQAITYRLGKDEIYSLRKEASARMGARFSPKEFHMLFMRYGTLPVGYFREELLQELSGK